MDYTVTVTLSADDSAEHLRSAREVEDEFRSWLEGLGATVHAVDVREEQS